jgi:putative ABC transport system ATP-binding protein
MYKDFSVNDSAEFRKKTIGMVYQQAHWVKSLNVEENTALPLRLLGIKKNPREAKAKEILQSMHMADWAKYHPYELSSGQQQKVSLSRALITNPRIIIADEPTGNLDYEAGKELITMLRKINKEEKKTVIMVTHDLEYLEFADECIRLKDGEIQDIFSPQEQKEKLKEIKMKKGNGK